MELHEMKNRAKSVKVPAMKFRSPQGSAETLIGLVRAEDDRDRKAFRRMMIFYAVAGIFYALVFVLTWIAPPESSPGYHRILLSVFGLLFLSAAYLSRLKVVGLTGIDYAQPIGAFLESAERRYRLISVREIVIGVIYFVLFAVTAAMGLLKAMQRYLPSVDPGTGILVYMCVLLITAVTSSILGISNWKKRKAPLLDGLRRMRSELNTEESEMDTPIS